MEKDLAHVRQNAFHYWFVDGLSDIVIGILFFIVGGITLLQGILEPGSAAYRFFSLLIFVVILVGTPLSRRLIRTFKERFTYPRTGYVTYHPPTSLQRAISVAWGILIVIIVLLLVIASWRTQITWLPSILGIMLAGILFLIGYRNAVVRYQIVAAGVAILGFFLSLLHAPEWLSIGIILSSSGLVLLFSGLITLVLYLHNTHINRETVNGS